jgi:rhomboid protease GluP
MYVISILINTRWPGVDLNYFTFLSPENQSLLFLGATGKIPIDAYSRWWTLISANYLHGNLLHIFFNLMALKQLGVLATREYGPFRTIIIYSLSGIAGYWISYFAGVNFTVGASAAICGLMGAMIYYGKKRGGMYGRIIYKQIGGWAIGMFLFGMLVPNINNWGHGGGLVAGALLGFILKFNEESVENRNHRLLGMGCLAVTFITLVWAVITGIYMRIIS